MSTAETVMGAVLAKNNDLVRRHAADRFDPNPRRIDECGWHRSLAKAYPAIRDEWDAFEAAQRALPLIEDLIDEHQGNIGEWRAGLLVSRGRPATALATSFPATLAALAEVPGLWSALWSVLEPGAEIPDHVGPNAGVLRYHLGIDCGDDAALLIGSDLHPYRDGQGILFDDTQPHAAWNHGPRRRVTLFLEVIRPVNGPARLANAGFQRLLAADPRYRRAPGRADAWQARSELAS